MRDDRIPLADVGVVCALDDRGRPVRSLPDGDADLEVIERFRDFLAVAGPPAPPRGDNGERTGPGWVFSLEAWEALDHLDPAMAAALAHHADRWTAQATIGWHA